MTNLGPVKNIPETLSHPLSTDEPPRCSSKLHQIKDWIFANTLNSNMNSKYGWIAFTDFVKKSSNVVWTVVSVSDRMIPVTRSWNLQCNLCCCKPSKCSLQKLHNVITQFEAPVCVYVIFKTIWWIKFDIANSWQANFVWVHIPSLPHTKFRLSSIALIMANHTKILAHDDKCGTLKSTTFMWTCIISVILNDIQCLIMTV